MREKALTLPALRAGSLPLPRCGRRAKYRLWLFPLLVGLFVAACATNDSSSDDNRRGGFYGSVTGGASRP
jgi:hypothetical protein